MNNRPDSPSNSQTEQLLSFTTLFDNDPQKNEHLKIENCQCRMSSYVIIIIDGWRKHTKFQTAHHTQIDKQVATPNH